MKWKQDFLLLLIIPLLNGCATLPSGPSVLVLPAPGKSFEAFQADDDACRQWAIRQTGIRVEDTVNKNLADGAVIGTLVGAGLGAAIGAASGNAGAGAAIGAGTGLFGGMAAASGPAYAAGWEVQRRYDIAYQQCMVAKGNQTPGVVRSARRSYWVPPPPPPGYVPGPPVSPRSGTYPPMVTP